MLEENDLCQSDKLPKQKEIELERNRLMLEANDIARESLSEFKNANEENRTRLHKLEKLETQSKSRKKALLVFFMFAWFFVEFIYDFGIDKSLSLSFVALLLTLLLDIFNR